MGHDLVFHVKHENHSFQSSKSFLSAPRLGRLRLGAREKKGKVCQHCVNTGVDTLCQHQYMHNC